MDLAGRSISYSYVLQGTGTEDAADDRVTVSLSTEPAAVPAQANLQVVHLTTSNSRVLLGSAQVALGDALTPQPEFSFPASGLRGGVVQIVLRLRGRQVLIAELPLPEAKDPEVRITPGMAELAFADGELTLQLDMEGVVETRDGAAVYLAESHEIRASVKSARDAITRVAIWIEAEDVPGLPPGQTLERRSGLIIAGEAVRTRIQASVSGLFVGRFAAVAETEDGDMIRVPFIIDTTWPKAELAASGMPPGLNIALAALGGSVEAVSSEYDSRKWRGENLIDGFAQIFDRSGGRVSSGWRTAVGAKLEDGSPDTGEFVLSFLDRQLARIDTVVFDTMALSVVTDDVIPTAPRFDSRGFPRAA